MQQIHPCVGFRPLRAGEGRDVPGTHTASFPQIILLSARSTHYSQSGTCRAKFQESWPAGPASVLGWICRGGVDCAYLQCTVIGPSCPNCSLVLCTCPMKSMKPSPVFGTPCSGQSVNWNWRMVLDWPSWRPENKNNQKKTPQKTRTPAPKHM